MPSKPRGRVWVTEFLGRRDSSQWLLLLIYLFFSLCWLSPLCFVPCHPWTKTKQSVLSFNHLVRCCTSDINRMVGIIFNIREEIYIIWWGPECWGTVLRNIEEILPTIREKYRYCEKTQNIAWTIYFMLVFQYSAPWTRVLFSIEKLLSQNEEAGMILNVED